MQFCWVRTTGAAVGLLLMLWVEVDELISRTRSPSYSLVGLVTISKMRCRGISISSASRVSMPPPLGIVGLAMITPLGLLAFRVPQMVLQLPGLSSYVTTTSFSFTVPPPWQPHLKQLRQKSQKPQFMLIYALCDSQIESQVNTPFQPLIP